jgi:hypothetical protein
MRRTCSQTGSLCLFLSCMQTGGRPPDKSGVHIERSDAHIPCGVGRSDLCTQLPISGCDQRGHVAAHEKSVKNRGHVVTRYTTCYENAGPALFSVSHFSACRQHDAIRVNHPEPDLAREAESPAGPNKLRICWQIRRHRCPRSLCSLPLSLWARQIRADGDL